MEETERCYRETSTTSRKYLKRLTEYISELVKRGRYLEANHFFLKLCEISPHHGKTIRLGYAIAIAVFDNDGVLRHDKLLTDSSPDISELLWFRLRYYQSRHEVSACEAISGELLKNQLNGEYLSTIIEVCLERQSYVIAEPLAWYLVKNRIALSPLANNRLKQTVVIRLIETLRGCR